MWSWSKVASTIATIDAFLRSAFVDKLYAWEFRKRDPEPFTVIADQSSNGYDLTSQGSPAQENASNPERQEAAEEPKGPVAASGSEAAGTAGEPVPVARPIDLARERKRRQLLADMSESTATRTAALRRR